MDGTLVDSRASIQAAMVRAFAAEGLPAPVYDRTRRIVGLSLGEAMAVLAPDLDACVRGRLVDGYKAAWIELHADPAFHEPLYAGAADLLARLTDEGWRLSMTSGKSRRGVGFLIRAHGWEALFVSTHCADDSPGKPHPAMLRAALAVSDIRPGRAVMIGDTGCDMAMARAAGVRALGVTWGFHTEAEVLAGGADHLGQDFRDLAAELDRFAASTRHGALPI